MKGQSVKGKGRPSSSTVMVERLVAAHNPELAGPNVFNGYGSRVDLVEETGLDAKLSRISAMIASRLENAAKSGSKLRDSETGPEGSLGAHRPWSSDDCPENVVFWAEAEFFANDRVVSGLTAHLVEHIAIGEELRQIALSARRRAQEELASLPMYMVEFANRLIACGVSRNDVHHMSKDRLNAVIAAIRGMDASTPGLVPDRLPLESSGSGHEGDRHIDAPGDDGLFGRSDNGGPDVGIPQGRGDSEEASGTAADRVPEGLDAQAPNGMGPLAETGDEGDAETGPRSLDGEVLADSEEGIDDVSDVPDAAPVPARPKNRWDDLDLTPLGYRIEEVTASTDADLAALRMKLPTVGSFRELALAKSPEVMMAEGIEEQRDRVILSRFFSRYCSRVHVRMSEAEQRLWGLLLVDVTKGPSDRQISANGWCHGLVLPGPEGTTKVRRIVSMDQSEEGLADALV